MLSVLNTFYNAYRLGQGKGQYMLFFSQIGQRFLFHSAAFCVFFYSYYIEIVFKLSYTFAAGHNVVIYGQIRSFYRYTGEQQTIFCDYRFYCYH